ncbi:MAG: glycoside hydrolase family 3 C-terminal domain-containing protein, partial [Verrucomicrobiota bacterium]|nr:glycoside hydrolase family 3 C-terminal domain-containing protein [Verrucomicrobiota bacterium]
MKASLKTVWLGLAFFGWSIPAAEAAEDHPNIMVVPAEDQRHDEREPMRAFPSGNMGLEEKIAWLVENMPLEAKLRQMNIAPRGKFTLDQPVDPEWPMIPALLPVDGPRGIRHGKSFCYPVPLAQAATWNEGLVENVGAAFGKMALSKGRNQVYAPGLNLTRHPLAGRNAEYFGEDPFLTGKMGVAVCRGIESTGVISTPKHFACNDFETGRADVDIQVSERVLQEIYLKPFHRAITEGKPRSVMTAYNSVNGMFSAANNGLLGTLLNKWGFNGFTVTDWWAEMGSIDQAIKAGTHVELPGNKTFTLSNLKRAFRDGSLSPEEFDQRFSELLRIKLQMPLEVKPASLSSGDMEQQRALMQNLARESLVLLKNRKDLLPVRPKQTLLLTGPFSDSDLILGNQGSSGVKPSRFTSLKDQLMAAGHPATCLEGVPVANPPALELLTDFPSRASYFNTSDLSGEPFLERDESQIQHYLFQGSNGGAMVQKGVLGNALSFTGQTDVFIGNSPKVSRNEDFVLSLWVYLPDQFPDPEGVFICGGVSSAVGSEIAGFEIMPSGVSLKNHHWNQVYWLKAEIPAQIWSHVVLRREKGQLSVRVNESTMDEKPIKNSIAAFPLFLGRNLSSTSPKYSNVLVDEVVFSTGADIDGSLQKQLAAKKSPPGEVALYQDCETVKPDSENILSGLEDPHSFSARWVGLFSPQRPGLHYFEIDAIGGVRMLVDGQLVIDQPVEARQHGMKRRVWLDFPDKHPREIQIEMIKLKEPSPHRRSPRSASIRFAYNRLDAWEGLAAAAAAAAQVDVAIVAVGIPAQEYRGTSMQGEQNDLDQYRLPGYQNALVDAVSRKNPNTVVLLFSAGGVAMPWHDQVSSIIECFYGGEESPAAIRDVLFGAYSPSGKLPVTYPKSIDQLAVDCVQLHYEKSVSAIGYRHFDKIDDEPLFPFGHGLSYTSFRYGDFRVDTTHEGIAVRATITNSGNRSGS